jgi:hypothetical protein
VCHDSLLVDPQKITTIIIMPTLTNVMKIKWFLGVLVFINVIFDILQSSTNVQITKEG